MRRAIALSLAAGACALNLECGNASFLLDTGAVDGSGDVAREIDSGDVSDSTDSVDARDARDALEIDAATLRDGTSLDDVQDEHFGDVADEPAHCAGGFACAPDVPAGWTGPLALYAGANAPPVCGANFSGMVVDGNAGLSAPVPTCACNCDVPQGVHCSVPSMTFYDSQTNCSAGTSCATVSPAQNACTKIDVTAQCLLGIAGAVMSAPASIPSQGNCLPLGASAAPTISWTTRARACAASAPPVQNDCPAGNVCAPVPAAPFRARVCIAQPGDIPCPAAGYTAKDLYYGAVDDTRACSPCSCGPVTGASCSATIAQFASGNGCTTPQTIYKLPASCVPFQQPGEALLSVTVSPGACKPSPTAPTGMATPARPMTFCCAR